MFIKPAFAQGSLFGGAGGEGGMLVSLLPFALIFVIMYFLILRPQQKRVKQHQEMGKKVRRGDTVVTNGGLIGKVTKVIDDDQLEIEIADDVRIRQMRQMVTDGRATGEPVKEGATTSASCGPWPLSRKSGRHALFHAVEGDGDCPDGAYRLPVCRSQFPAGEAGAELAQMGSASCGPRSGSPGRFAYPA